MNIVNAIMAGFYNYRSAFPSYILHQPSSILNLFFNYIFLFISKIVDNHFTKQTNRKQLNADYYQQHTKKQHRSVAQRLTLNPEHCQISENDQARKKSKCTEEAEKMQWSFYIAGCECDSNQVNKSLEKS